LILEEATSQIDLDAALKKNLTTIATPIVIGEHSILVTMSIGVAIYPEAGASADSLLKHADEAMYAAKNNQKIHMLFISLK
jgi:diguanylate cyclase